MAKSLKLIIILIAIIFLGLYVYKQYFPKDFPPDTNVVTQIPPDVEKQFLGGPATAVYSYFKIPILLYHYVEYVKDRGDTIRISLNIEPDIFESQVKTLKDAGYTFLTPSDIPDLLVNKTALPLKPVILSFDDGYRDFYTDVFPILKKYHVRAVAYIVPGFLDKHNNLTRKQLKEIADSGLVEIAAHTVNHTYLRGLNPKRVHFEVEQSKAMLEGELKIPIVSFAYPYGAFDVQSIDIVKNAGFKSAVSTVPGVDVSWQNVYFLYRLRPGYRSGQSLLNFLSQSKFSNY